MFSPDRWALVGEAGVFTDPFYSPGSDFIAMGNDCAADLITRTARGEDVAERVEAFNTTYLRLFDAFIRVYDGQYPLMGNAQVMTAKAAWDNSAYWAITALLYFQRRYRQPEFIASIEPLMRRFFVLHARMQQFLRAWDLADARVYADDFTNVVSVDILRELQASLAGPMMEDDALRARLERNFALLERIRQHLAGVRDRAEPVAAAVRAGPGAGRHLAAVHSRARRGGDGSPRRRRRWSDRCNHHRRIVAAEPERRGDAASHGLLPRRVGDDVDGAVRVGLAVVDRRRDDAA